MQLLTRAPAALKVAFLLLLLGASHGQLQFRFYSDSCPDAEDIVTAVVQNAAASDATILPALVRLQFHDCFVRGCDASVLITSTGNTAEVNNIKHQGLRGQNVIDAAKEELEDQCPGVVSCADIIALASRDAIAMTNGPSFQVPTGRRDGLFSNVRDADVLPDVSDSIQVLRSKFAASGLNDRDLVLLTAAHTIGTTACFFVKDRLYNYHGGTGSDPSIPTAFLSELKARCAPGDFNTRLPLDRGSGQLRRLHLPQHTRGPRPHCLRRCARRQQHHGRARRRIPRRRVLELRAGLRGRYCEDGHHRRHHRRVRRSQGRLLLLQLQLIDRFIGKKFFPK